MNKYWFEAPKLYEGQFKWWHCFFFMLYRCPPHLLPSFIVQKHMYVSSACNFNKCKKKQKTFWSVGLQMIYVFVCALACAHRHFISSALLHVALLEDPHTHSTRLHNTLFIVWMAQVFSQSSTIPSICLLVSLLQLHCMHTHTHTLTVIMSWWRYSSWTYGD